MQLLSQKNFIPKFFIICVATILAGCHSVPPYEASPGNVIKGVSIELFLAGCGKQSKIEAAPFE
jgi:hypothetical protein